MVGAYHQAHHVGYDQADKADDPAHRHGNRRDERCQRQHDQPDSPHVDTHAPRGVFS